MKNFEYIQKVLTPEELCNHQAKILACHDADCGEHIEECPFGYEEGEECPGCGYYAWLMSDLDMKWFRHEISRNEQIMTFKQWLLWQEWKKEDSDDEAIVYVPVTDIRSLSEEELRKKYHDRILEYERDKTLILLHPEIKRFEDTMKAIRNVKTQKDAEEFALLVSWYYFLKKLEAEA